VTALPGDEPGEQAALHRRTRHPTGEQAGGQHGSEIHERTSNTNDSTSTPGAGAAATTY